MAMWPPPREAPAAAPTAAHAGRATARLRVLVAAQPPALVHQEARASAPSPRRIDREVDDTAVACRLLAAFACEARRVATPRLAVEALASARYDLVLVDCRHAPMFGVDIVHAI